MTKEEIKEEKKERYIVGQIIGSADNHIIDTKDQTVLPADLALAKILNILDEISKSL